MDIRALLDSPKLYAAWQYPFIAQKVAPFLEANKVSEIGRVLEIGCGPGTNATLFAENDYVGIDLNSQYIESAQKQYQRTFLCADATSFELEDATPFDAVFINSLLHHLDDSQVEATLLRARSVLRANGVIHICDLVLPEKTSVARYLAQMDRGDFPRPLDAWQLLFSKSFRPDLFRAYPVKFCGVPCWNMVYFRGVVE